MSLMLGQSMHTYYQVADIISKMNLSKTQDPFRFLKRKKTVTPQKSSKDNSLQQHYRILPDHLTSLAESKISKIQETHSKENHYDPNKYYSERCENYLNLIKFNQRQAENKKQVKQEKISIERIKTNQSKDSLQQILRTKQKQTAKPITINEKVVQQLTFKKIEFESNSQKSGPKMTQAQQNNIQLGYFNEDDYEIVDGTSSVNAQRKQCPTCSRFFILASYQKHIKVCEKVFFKKRKTFSSQKQRSQSKQKKPK